MSFEVSYEPGVKEIGTCIEVGSTYLGDGDSTYWVTVARPGGEETDGEGFRFERVGTGWYPPRNFVADAPPEAWEAWEAEKAAERAAAQARAEELRRLDEEREAATPRKGKTVEVIRGRKVPIGTRGEVFWYGEGKNFDRWGRGSAPMRVGFKDAAGETHWTDAYNVEVVQSAAVAA